MRIPGLNWLAIRRRVLRTRREGVSQTVISESVGSLQRGLQKVADEVRREEQDTAPLSDSAYKANRWLGEWFR